MLGFNKTDLVAGIGVLALGAFVLFVAKDYGYGTARRMGGGFFPINLGVLIMLMGVAIILIDGRRPGGAISLPRMALRPLAAIGVGMVAFSLLVESAGLAPAMAAVVFLSAFAERNVKLVRAALTAIGMATVSVLIFDVGLDLQVEAFAW